MTPRIRPDLKALATEDQGVRYFDVSDPRSGSRMRMYDFEWLIAERMDGRRPFDEVATWARDRLGINPTPQDLSEYAQRLRELGFFEFDAERPAEADIEVEVDAPTSPVPKLEVAELASAPAKPKSAPEPARAAPESPGRATGPLTPLQPMESSPPSTTGKLEVHREAQPRKSGSGSMIGIILVMLAVAGVVGYMKFGAPQAAYVTVQLASPREVVRLHDGSAAVNKADALVLAFGEPGTVVEVVAKGTEAKAGMVLATLDGFAKLEKDLADVKDRLAFYEKQVALAKAKNAEDKNAEGKVAEKKKVFADLTARVSKVRLIAPTSGTVTEVRVSIGAAAKAGEPVVRMGDKRLTADFKVAGAEAPKTGETASAQPAAGGATISGSVIKAEGGTVTVELPDESAKPGDLLRLVKKKEQNVIPLPASAVLKRDGAEVVFVLTDGEAKLRKVTVSDRNASEVLISSGLATGDSVITSGGDALSDGQKASTQ